MKVLDTLLQKMQMSDAKNWLWRHSAFVFAVLLAVVVIGVYILQFKGRPLSINTEDWGQFGDYFGGVLNPIVAGLALFLLAISVNLQRTELAETRKALSSQAASASRQTFEGTFFQLLARFESVKQSVSVPPHKGNAALSDLINWVRREFQKGDQGLLLQGAVGSYHAIYQRFEPELGPYFRTLYHVFKLIFQSGLEESEQIRYANIARAALSTDELFLLFYNGLTKEGMEFKILIEEYGLLKHLRKERLIHGPDVYGSYSETAFLSAAERACHPEAITRRFMREN